VFDTGVDAYIEQTAGWKRFMEWKYPVEVVITSPGTFKAAGAIEAAASL
jgi:hypothetical protein